MFSERRPRILLVEDNRDVSYPLSLLLKGEGYETIAAEDGREGFRRAVAAHPDLIITDIQMPNTNGLDLIPMLHGHPETRAIPIIVTSAFEDLKLDRACKLGVRGFLKKPYDIDAFLSLVSTVLRTAQRNVLSEGGADADDIASQGAA